MPNRGSWTMQSSAATLTASSMSSHARNLAQRALHTLGYAALRKESLQKVQSRADVAEANLEAALRELAATSSRLATAEAQAKRLAAAVASLEQVLAPHPMPEVQPQFAATGFATAALQKLLHDHEFHSVLDIGAGSLAHSKVFAAHGKAVTAVDFGTSVYHQQRTAITSGQIVEVIGDFNHLTFDSTFDCVWASHVLEHQVNVDGFLRKMASHVKEGGIIAVTVPPLKHEIVGGHVSLWNAGLLIYRLVLVGLDCSQASILSYGYNISVIVKKSPIRDMDALGLHFDAGDIRKLIRYFPSGLAFSSNAVDDPFDGNIRALNW